MAKKIGYHSIVINTNTGKGTAATITVYNTGTLVKPVIYSNSTGTVKVNPFDTDSVGRFSFFIDPGEYDIKISGGGIVTYTLTGVSIIGEFTRFVISDPIAGERRIKKLRLGADDNIKVTYDGVPEP